MGRMEAPKYQGRQGGALVVVAVDVGADGAPDPATQTTERMELRDPNKFAEARYLDIELAKLDCKAPAPAALAAPAK